MPVTITKMPKTRIRGRGSFQIQCDAIGTKIKTKPVIGCAKERGSTLSTNTHKSMLKPKLPAPPINQGET